MTKAKNPGDLNSPFEQGWDADLTSDRGSTVSELLTSQEIADRKAWIAALYPDEAVAEIAKASHFTSEKDISDTKEFLLKAGYWYADHKNDRHPRASYAVEREQLETAAKYASKLRGTLTDMTDIAATWLWHPFRHMSQFINPMMKHGEKTTFGLTIKKYKHGEDGFSIHYMNPDDIKEAIQVVENLATLVANSLPNQTGGQPQDFARLSWITSAMLFWRDHSEKAFDHRSVAFRFCQLGYGKLDPNVSERQIASAMRAARLNFPAASG